MAPLGKFDALFYANLELPDPSAYALFWLLEVVDYANELLASFRLVWALLFL